MRTTARKRTTAKKTHKPVYEPVLKLPALPYEQFLALRDNIAVNGVLVPILVDGDGPMCEIIDGNYQTAIANELWVTLRWEATSTTARCRPNCRKGRSDHREKTQRLGR